MPIQSYSKQFFNKFAQTSNQFYMTPQTVSEFLKKEPINHYVMVYYRFSHNKVKNQLRRRLNKNEIKTLMN